MSATSSSAPSTAPSTCAPLTRRRAHSLSNAEVRRASPPAAVCQSQAENVLQPPPAWGAQGARQCRQLTVSRRSAGDIKDTHLHKLQCHIQVNTQK